MRKVFAQLVFFADLQNTQMCLFRHAEIFAFDIKMQSGISCLLGRFSSTEKKDLWYKLKMAERVGSSVAQLSFSWIRLFICSSEINCDLFGHQSVFIFHSSRPQKKSFKLSINMSSNRKFPLDGSLNKGCLQSRDVCLCVYVSSSPGSTPSPPRPGMQQRERTSI